MKDSQREQIKLSATYFNGLAIAFAAVGAFSFTFQFGLAHPERVNEAGPTIIIIASMLVSGFLHLFARHGLKDLDKDSPPSTPVA